MQKIYFIIQYSAITVFFAISHLQASVSGDFVQTYAPTSNVDLSTFSNPAFAPTASSDKLGVETTVPGPHYPGSDHVRLTTPDSPGFNSPTPDQNFQGTAEDEKHAIKFTPVSLATGSSSTTDQDSQKQGRFWNTTPKDNPMLIYGGAARIGNDRFVDVILVDKNNVDHSGESDSFERTDIANIYQPETIKGTKFDPDYLTLLGTMLHNGKTIELYGRYVDTVIPDPETIENIGTAVPEIQPAEPVEVL